MRKSDLKTGMIVETRGGNRGTIFLDNIYEQDAVVFAKNNWTGLDAFGEDLKWYPDINQKVRSEHAKSVDIVKVYKPDLPTGFFTQESKFGPLKLLWERKPDIRDNMTIGKWYLNKLGGVFCFTGGFDEDGDPFGYGWLYDEDDETYEWADLCEGSLDGWTVVGPASESKVLELFKQEATKRQLVAGTLVKGGFCRNATEDQIIQSHEDGAYSFNSNDFRLIGASERGHALMVFDRGEWIEVLSTYEKPKVGTIVRIINGGMGALGATGKLGMVVCDASIISDGIYQSGGVKVQIGTRIWGLPNDCIIKEVK